jgi:hypothetical protein
MSKGRRPVDAPRERRNSVDPHLATIIVAIIGLVGSVVATVISTTAKSQSETTQNKQTQFEERFSNLKGIDIQSGNLDAKSIELGWTLGQPRDKGRIDPDLVREWTKHVKFDHPFSAQPVVRVGISGLDSWSKTGSTGLYIYAGNVTTTGFDLVIMPWNDLEVYSLTAEWIAYQQ